jgi:hypothetical protein
MVRNKFGAPSVVFCRSLFGTGTDSHYFSQDLIPLFLESLSFHIRWPGW